MLKIKCNISIKEVEAFLLKAETYIMDCMKEALAELAKECDERARNNNGGWMNRTGNLRSSIGAAVYENGEVFFTTTFKQVLGGSRGSAEGRNLISSLASQYRDVVAMVVVAGMDYAEKVEALESKDVLESTRLWAESVVIERLEEAKRKAENEINTWRL